MTLPRGLRNKNPLNIRESADGGAQWVGESVLETDASFEEFSDSKYGYRAATRILRNYRLRGIVTVQGIVATWAPANENNVSAYIDSVVSKTGFQPGHIVAESEGDYITLFKAMAIHEVGATYALHPDLAESKIAEGVALA